ncbi:NADPH-dependent FMN reductase [Streptomyces griseorubiginosus]|uniref:NADPH-dependent FMN reductase n=1 Tax=Streptomyces griseorubiginosus TaxID=67304 RepID=UPI001AD6AC61|nr:NAD(P)H-dependent oxidoreductase [Streptomyces griseorubiginosus]MBO4257286.1 NADPH-dependent FMN reductase [Streptomyces griseorubiginosus]
MSASPLRLAVICASVREGRFGPTVARWITDQARRRGDLEVDYIDLADHPLPVALSQSPSAADAEVLAQVTPRLESADAFVVVTPEYNHSYPASLKSLIDWHYTQWRAKPVGLVSYGGLAGGLRAAEHLRPVFAELHAVTIREQVSFHNAWEKFEEDGTPKEPEAAVAAAKTMLDQLSWWGEALREARRKRPYGQ